MSMSTIYAASWLVNPDAPPVPGGAILVSDGIIKAAGTLDEISRSCSAPVIEHPGCALMPGLVNAHTHLELTHFPSWRLRSNVDYHPHRFVDWIIQLIKIKRGLKAADYAASVTEGIRMCLESGTTAVGEIISDPTRAPLYRSSRLGGRLFFELVGHDANRFQGLLEQTLAACDDGNMGSFRNGLSPHTPYTIGEQYLPAIREAALLRKLPLAIHLSESSAETDFIFDSSGPLAEEFYPFVTWEQYLAPPRRCTSTKLLDQAGLLTPATSAIHCVQITRADAGIIRERGVTVVLCPRSNERLDVGRAPVALFRKLGIPLALGTDSLASNDSLSLWDEMRFALDTFPRDLSPGDVFRMATIGGAEALGLGAECGSLETGKRADFLVIGSLGSCSADLKEQVLRTGKLEDIYMRGVRYAGTRLPAG